MEYLVLTQPSIEYAKQISKFLYSLSVPSQDQATKYFNGWITHPTTGSVALVFGTEEIPIHPHGNAILLVDTIRQAITEPEATEIETRINEGGTAKPLDFLPQSLSSNLLTEQQAKDNGWLPELSENPYE